MEHIVTHLPVRDWCVPFIAGELRLATVANHPIFRDGPDVLTDLLLAV